jgi:hypothetical protein
MNKTLFFEQTSVFTLCLYILNKIQFVYIFFPLYFFKLSLINPQRVLW